MANTIQDKLTYLSGTKDAIKQAIISKGVEVSDTDTFRSYANKIEAIQSGGGSGTGSLIAGTKLAYSTFSTIPDEYISYLETQTDMSCMFYFCRSLTTVPAFDTKNVTDMAEMFNFCKSLKTIPLLDTKNVNNTNGMFKDCEKLQTVPAFDTKNVTDMAYMFNFCSSLKTIPLLDTKNVTDMGWMFTGCYSLTNLGGFTGLQVDLDLSDSSELTVDSVMNIINNAKNITSEPVTLSLHQYVFDKLSQEQIATASAKGWNIASI